MPHGNKPPSTDGYGFGSIIDVQIVIQEQAHAEQRVLALVGDDFDPLPFIEPFEKTGIGVELMSDPFANRAMIAGPSGKPSDTTFCCGNTNSPVKPVSTQASNSVSVASLGFFNRMRTSARPEPSTLPVMTRLRYAAPRNVPPAKRNIADPDVRR